LADAFFASVTEGWMEVDVCVAQAENRHAIDHDITSADHDWWRRSTPIIPRIERASMHVCVSAYIRHQHVIEHRNSAIPASLNLAKPALDEHERQN